MTLSVVGEAKGTDPLFPPGQLCTDQKVSRALVTTMRMNCEGIEASTFLNLVLRSEH